MKIPRLNTDRLLTFCVVAVEGSFSEAAGKLCLSQPAVTMQVRALEEESGVKLFYVRKKRAHLTPQGELLLPLATEVYRAVVRAEELLSEHSSAKSLHIGVAGALSTYVYPLIDLFSELYPTVRVSVREARSQRLVEELLEYRHDLCFVGAVDGGSEELIRHRIHHRERSVLVVAQSDPLAQKGPLSWEEVARIPLYIHGEGSVARKTILEEFARRGLTPNVAGEADSVSFLKHRIERRGGVALMFSPNVEAELAAEKLRVLDWEGGEINVGVDVAVRAPAEHSPARDAFLKVLKSRFGGDFDYVPP